MVSAKFLALIRRLVIIVLLTTGLGTFITGILLYMAPSGPAYLNIGGLIADKRAIGDLHTWFGFIASGTLVLHLYLNNRALLRYLKP